MSNTGKHLLKGLPGKIKAFDIILLLSLAIGCAWLYFQIGSRMESSWNWAAVPQYLFRFDQEAGLWVPGLITEGAFVTLRVSLWAMAAAIAAGLFMGLFRTARSRSKRILGLIYVESVRNIPVLVWIFIFYYFISERIFSFIGIDAIVSSAPWFHSAWANFLFGSAAQFPTLISGVAALAVYEGAYITEIVRAGIESVEKGQSEASRRQNMRHIVFTQELERMLPPLAGQFISIIKDSSVISVISIQELTFQGMELTASTFLTFEIWTVIMAIYFVICLLCSLLIERFELHLRKT